MRIMFINYQREINMMRVIRFSLIVLFGMTINYSQVKLDVNTIPAKVDILLDGVNIGSSPIRNERITPGVHRFEICLLYTSPSPRDATLSRMPSSA